MNKTNQTQSASLKRVKDKGPGFFVRLFGFNQPALKQPWILSLFFLTVFFLLWHYVFPAVVPRMQNVIVELQVLIVEKGMVFELGQTLKLVFKAMGYSILVAFPISFLGATTNIGKPIARVFPYFRFWSTLGFAPIIRIWIGGGSTFQVVLLMFAIVPFLVTAFNSVLRKVEKDPLYDYARTLGYPEWKCIYYVVVRSKLVQFYIEIRNNFAIAWLMAPVAEIANRDGGGIGAMIFDYTRFVPGEDPYAAALALNMVVLACGIVLDFLFRKLLLTLQEERAKLKNNK